MQNYILLANGEPVACDNVFIWGHWFESSADERRIARDTVADGVDVSTVFLGIDHNWYRNGPPVLYETLIFGGDRDGEMERYPTREAAIAGHARIIASFGVTQSESVYSR